MNERDVTTLWRKLFDGQTNSGDTLAKAKSHLQKLSPESPLRLRLGTELEEMQKLRQKK